MGDTNSESFTAILTEDVARALSRQQTRDSQSARRDLVRSAFAAIEGWVWVLREEVMETAKQTKGLNEDEIAVLSERTFYVSNSGDIKSRPNHLDLKTTIRLCAKIANRVTQQKDIDFSEVGWEKLQNAKDIRNRITHPKNINELILEPKDVDNVLDAFFWISDKILDVIETSVNVREDHLGQIEAVLNGLDSGDPEISGLYQALAAKRNES